MSDSTLFSRENNESWAGVKVGVITAGDDSQGINAALRAVVRMGMYVGCTVVYIMKGFKGLVEGGAENFIEADWISTSDIIGSGGSAIKGFKCPEFTERAVRMKAVQNLVENGICNLVAIGGDGTMRGISCLHSEWVGLLRDMDDKDLVDREKLQECRNFKVICVPSSIVNDVCGTDFAIGVDSALHRVVDAIDALSTTSCSSRVAYVIEVMGGDSGYLALSAGVSCDASMIFIPEWPPEGDWQENLVAKVRDDIFTGQESIMVIVSQGTSDRSGKPITVENIKNVLENKLNLTTTTTTLGDIQRGGVPSFYDRVLATRLGAESILCLRDLKPEDGPVFLGIHINDIRYMSLAKALEITDMTRDSIKEQRFSETVKLQGSHFQNLLSCYNIMNGFRSSPIHDPSLIPGLTRIGIVRVGKGALAQAWATRAIVGYCQSVHTCPVIIRHGFEGLVNEEYNIITWDNVKNWTSQKTVSTTYLGSSILTAKKVGLEKIAQAIENLDIKGLIILGSFHAYESLVDIYRESEKYKGLQIPMCVIPMTVNNNIPGADTTIGSDTALNEIVAYCDKMKRAARGYRNSVFIVETMGQNCGYLPTLAGLAVGAERAYIKQRPFNLDNMLTDAAHVIDKFSNSGVFMTLFVRGENASDNYDLDFLHKLFKEEGKDHYECRASAIGHVQLGARSSPRDRITATSDGIRCAEWMCTCIEEIQAHTDLAEDYKKGDLSKTVLVTRQRQTHFDTISKLTAETDFEQKIPTFLWWMKLLPLIRIMAKQFHEVYFKEGTHICEDEKDNERLRYGLRARSSIFVA